MAFNKAPTELWSGYSSDGTDITIPIAALPGLTVGQAHTTTGDWRAIMQAIETTVFNHYNELATADKPLAFVPRAPTQYPVTSGSFAGKFRITYSCDVYSTLGSPTVADEPA